MAETLGVENLKKALALVIGVIDKVDELTQDGWQFLTDTLSLLPTLIEIPSVIKNGKAVVAEFKDLTDEEREEVLLFVQEKFDLEDDKLEAIVEKALKILSEVAGLAKAIKNAKAN